jgi:hypothetical protein
MQYQEKRGIVFLAGNVILTSLYLVFMALNWHDRMVQVSADLAFWAIAALVYVPLQVAIRLVTVITFAVVHHVTANAEPVDLEDEMDKLIDLKATSLSYGLFMAGVLVGLACLAFGLPAQALVIAIGAAMIVSGLAGDLAQLIMYRRGV